MTETLPDDVSLASASPIDSEESDNKKKKLNSRPVNVLMCYSKIYETIIKMQQVPFLNIRFPPFLGVCRESYSKQYELIRLRRMEFEFDCIPHNLLIKKLAGYGLHFLFSEIFA